MADPAAPPSFWEMLRHLTARNKELPSVTLPNPELQQTLGERFRTDPLGSLVELMRGAIVGSDPHTTTRAQQFGELLAAGAPLAGGAKALKQAVAAEKAGEAALDLSHAARMERAAELGFTQDVYHGTQKKWSWMDDPALRAQFDAGEDIVGPTSDALHEFKVNRGGGLKMMDGMGTHAGTARAAQERLEKNVGAKFGTPTRPVDPGVLSESYVLPLKGRAQKPFTKTDGTPYTESELQSRLSMIAKKLGYTNTRAYSSTSAASPTMREAQRAVKAHLQELGYDSIPYINSHEDRGSISWVFFEPNQLRSRFAKFDPSNLASSDLLAGLAGLGLIPLSQLGQSQTPETR